MRRDPKRLATPAERRRIASGQGWECHYCSTNLTEEAFEVHHLVRHADYGLTTPDNLVAVCRPCHRTAPVVIPEGFTPREWQTDALEIAVARITEGDFATVNAAPGAGKSLLAGLLFRELERRGVVDRLAVFVPSSSLRSQWVDSMRSPLGIHLLDAPVESNSHDGTVATYHALSTPDFEQILEASQRTRTLVVLDEVHHLAMKARKGGGREASAWSVAINRLVGSVDNPRGAVVNLTGTLFRSRPDERISTVRYNPLSSGQIETVADVTVSAAELIARGELRPITCLAFDADMNVTGLDVREYAAAGEGMRSINLDEKPPAVRRELLEGLFRDEAYIDAMLGELQTRLAHASTALGGHHVKGLVVTQTRAHADIVYRRLVHRIGERAAFLSTGETDASNREIDGFRRTRQQAILVVVGRGTEGFDAPDVAAIAYLKSWSAGVYVNQLVARAMRVTERERELEVVIPAQVLIPADPAIVEAFGRVLAGPMELATLDDPCPACGELACVCVPVPRGHKVCDSCRMPFRVCVCECSGCGKSRYHGCSCDRPRVTAPPGLGITVETSGDLSLSSASVNGERISGQLIAQLDPALAALGVSELQRPTLVAAASQILRNNPLALDALVSNAKENSQ